MVSYNPQGASYFTGGSRYNQTYPVVIDFTTGVLDPRIDLQRTAAANYFTSGGLIASAGANVPRFDYSPDGATYRGLQIEAAATNEAIWCRDLTQSTWVKSNITAALNQTGLTGVASSASSLTATSGNGTCLQTITSTSSTRFVSAYVKRLVGSGNIDMTLDNGSTWTTVTVTAGWTRVYTSQASVTNPVCGFRIVTSGDSIAVDYVQEEKTRLTSPVENGGAQAGRVADRCLLKGMHFNEFWNPFEGTVYLEYMHPVALSGTTIYVASINNGTTTDTFNLFADAGASNTRLVITTGNVSQCSIGPVTTTALAVVKIAFSYKLNAANISINGAATLNDASVGLPQTMTQIDFGRLAGGGQSAIWLRKFKYWNTEMVSSLPTLST